MSLEDLFPTRPSAPKQANAAPPPTVPAAPPRRDSLKTNLAAKLPETVPSASAGGAFSQHAAGEATAVTRRDALEKSASDSSPERPPGAPAAVVQAAPAELAPARPTDDPTSDAAVSEQQPPTWPPPPLPQ